MAEHWSIPATTFRRHLVAGFEHLHAGYASRFEARVPALVEWLVAVHARPDALTCEVQYAEAPGMTPAETRLRWALRTGQPGAVARLAGVPADVVWVHLEGRWYALAGLDEAATALVQERAGPACAAALDPACVSGPCLVDTYRVYRAALTDDADDLERACARVKTLAR